MKAFSYPWIPDVGDGTYRNPIIHADYSDPDVIRHGDDFWMISSSFHCTPGLPVLHSHDLVNWTLVNHAIQQVPHESYTAVRPGCGVWAPAIRFHGGRFWIFFPMPDEGIYVTCADDPAGQWAEPWLLQEARGWIDPCPFWDDDGNAYLVHAFANSRAGKKERIHIRPMSPDCRCLLGEGREVIHAPHHPYLEGPKVHKLDGWYYIFAPGGGVQTGWQVVFRSRNLWGPYEEKVVLEQGSTAINGPHQGALVDLENGEWWFVHFQDAGAFGRIVHLQPVCWEDGWPLIGVDFDGNGVGEPVDAFVKPRTRRTGTVSVPETSDEFDGEKLGRQWQWTANHEAGWADLHSRPGWLRLRALAASEMDLRLCPHFLAQKFPARHFMAETFLDFGEGEDGGIAGIAVVGGAGFSAVGIRREAGGFALVQLIDGKVHQVSSLSSAHVHLRVVVEPTGRCIFSFFEVGRMSVVVPFEFHAKEGGWVGARAGLFHIMGPGSTRCGYAGFDYFRFSPPDIL